jgi:BirA family biotin operon repressor/biotin-[acetyl-CoA-carboxylase] ligase
VLEPARTSQRGRWRVQRYRELDSTNAHLMAAARGGAEDGLVVVAEHQTAGRGRLDRRWEAPPGSSLLVSVLLRHPGSADSSLVVMAAGLALTEAVETVAGVTPGLKWPNDLVVADRKLAGLLAESSGDALVVGVGCNVNWETFPPELAAAATACNLETGSAVDGDALLDAYLDAFALNLDALDAVLETYRAQLTTLGRRVRVEQLSGAMTVGTAVDVNARGALVVRDDAGAEHRFTVGDVVHLRD